MAKRLFAAAVVLLMLASRAQAQDPKLVVLTSLTYASAVYDTETTRSALRRCGVCAEQNPFMRPFVNNGASVYSASMGFTSVTTYATHRLKKEGVRWWWVPMASTVAMHVFSGIHNQRLPGNRIPK